MPVFGKRIATPFGPSRRPVPTELEYAEKVRSLRLRTFPIGGLERREVEKSSTEGKEAAHGFRNLSVIKITCSFERQMTQMKTKFDEIMNGGRTG